MERDTGQDKTDETAEQMLADKATHSQTLMPFFESEPDIPYAVFPKEIDKYGH